MKKNWVRIAAAAWLALAWTYPVRAQHLGVTCGWSYGNDLTGPYTSSANNPLFNPLPGQPNATWDDWAEQLAASGVDFVCPNLRGSWPYTDQNPTNIAPLLTALKNRGLTNSLKLAIFDDNAASWTWQWDAANGYNNRPFDISQQTNWVYLWDYNYKLFYQTVPDANRFKINGRPPIIIWSGSTVFVTNMQGNASRAIQYVRQQCQNTFGFNPFIILSADFLSNDTTCNNTNIADGIHNWFAQGSSGYTLTSFHGVKIGALCPEFQTPAFGSGWIDPQHGQTLANNLVNTRGSGALLTLAEGFTDWEESAAMFRVNNIDSGGNELTYDQTYYDYPNQRLNLLRRYGNHPNPCERKFEAEACDYYGGANGGNGQANYYRNGNLALEPAGDAGGGYDVGWIYAGEWLEWEEVPLQGSQVHLRVRVASPNDNSSVHFEIDGVIYPSLTVPNTGNWQVYTTIESGTTYVFPKDSTHTVRLVCDTGGFNINYWDYHDDVPIGKLVVFQSTANNLLVTATNSTSPLIASQSVAGPREEFLVVDQSSSYWYGCVALKSLGNSFYVTADPNGATWLLANGTNAGVSQTFQWTDNGDGTISLRALVNNMDVTAESAGAAPLINNRILTGPWETFALAPVPVNLVANLVGSSLTISWPPNYAGWILQTNSASLATGGQWGDVVGSQNSIQWNVAVSGAGAVSRFFRLRQP